MESKIEVLEDEVKTEVTKVVDEVKTELDRTSPLFRKLFAQEITQRLDALINFTLGNQQGDSVIYKALLEVNLITHKLLLSYNNNVSQSSQTSTGTEPALPK